MNRFIGRSHQGPKCTIKVNNIPKSVTVEKLSSHFTQHGQCSVEFYSPSLGYALISYSSKHEARRVIRKTNGTFLDGGAITVYIKGDDASNNHTVKVTFLPKQVTQDELEKLFSLEEETDLVSVKLNSTPDSLYNYAYVNYGSYRDAQQAESRLNGMSVYGSRIHVKLHGKTPDNLQLSNANPSRSLHPVHVVPSPLSFQFQGSVPATVTPAITQPPATTFNTLKVSIHGSLAAEDLERVFSNYGTLKNKPIIRQGTPNYAYVNFEEAQDALTAYRNLNNRNIHGVTITIRAQQGQKRPSLIPPQAQTLQTSTQDQHSSLSHECRPIACRHLVARLLTMPSGRYTDQIQAVCQSKQVVVKPMKGGNGVNILGDKDKLSTVEVCVQLIIDKIESELDQKTFTLPCHFIPQFANVDILKRVSEIEEKHSVEVLVLNEKQQEEDPRLFVNLVTSQLSDQSGTAITVSCFSKYLLSSSSSAQTASTTQQSSSSDYVWLWQDDDGSFTPYTPDLCNKLNEKYKLSSTGSFTFTVPTRMGTATYSVNFRNMMQTNVKTSNARCIVQETAGGSQWFYQDDTKTMVPYSAQDSTQIEKMMKSGTSSPLTINGRVYSFDFNKMVQINVSTGHKRKIQRNSVARSSSTNDDELCIRLNVHGLSDSIPQAIAELKSSLQKPVVKKSLPLPQSSDEEFHASLLKTTQQYLVSTKIVNGKLQIEGMQSYVNSVELVAMKMFYAHEKKILSQAASIKATEFPENWETQTEKIALKPVGRGSTEWNKVAGLVAKTLSHLPILKIERIQNKWLWEKYSFSKQRMIKKNRGTVNEKLLFHGTRNTPPEKVFKSEQGFDFRFASKGLWGTGTYFAVNASYSECYAYHSGAVKQLILANVLTGETYRSAPDGNLKKPPVKTPSLASRLGSAVSIVFYGSSSATDDFEDELYDSVSGHAQGSDIFIIYDHEKAYPAYLITFPLRPSI